MKKCDFSGWASKNNLRCGDGRIIKDGAFKANDGKRVPLVWNHQHHDPDNVLGHAILENRDEGVYAYCYFNSTPKAQHAKDAVQHGDITALSIWANNLQQIGSEVLHGNIREVSLVLAGRNPGAFIESVMSHGEPMDDGDDEGIFYTSEHLVLTHAEENKTPPPDKEEREKDGGEETVGEVFNTLTDKQKAAVAVIVGQAIKDTKEGDQNKEEEEDEDMKHNAFEAQGKPDNFLAHSIEYDMEVILTDAKRVGSLKEAVIANMEEGGALSHAVPTDGMTTATGTQTYGFNDPSMLFPEYKALNTAPEWISRNMDWVQKVLGKVHHTPFSRIKSLYANITEDEARAKGYIKGKMKKEEVFTLLKRTTDPQTIYKKQKLDRDDIIDIVDFDVVAWIKAEMRVMLNEEIARAILIGDGRPADSDDKIQENHIRPIVKDAALYNTIVKVSVPNDATEDVIAKETVKAIIRARKNYKGSGRPTFWTTEDSLTEMLLLEDGVGRTLYNTENELSTKLRVDEIVPVEPMEGYKLTIDSVQYPLIGLICNLADYNVGADKGGQIALFDDFDIDFNQQKYLIETRISGALIKPFSALTVVLDRKAATPGA